MTEFSRSEGHSSLGRRIETAERDGPERTTTALVVVLIGSALVLGGASTPKSWAGFAFQVVALVVLVTGVLRLPREDFAAPPRWAWLLCGVVALSLVHLVPLPVTVWASLPGRLAIQQSLETAGVPLSLMSLSLAPGLTVAAALHAVPLAALLALLMRADRIPIIPVSATVVGVALLSFLLGVLQVAGGTNSPLYFHAVTNRGLAVGFFANANHLATLFVVCLPLIAALIAAAIERKDLPRAYALIALAGFSIIAALGITLSGSVAGIALFVVAVAASFFLVPSSTKARSAGLVGALGFAALAVGVSVGVLGTSFDDGQGSRPEMWRTTIAGIGEFWPVGGGLGSFPAVYPLFEDPGAVGYRFINHAHNDYLEVLFEAGLPGAALILAIIAWWGRQTFRAWQSGTAAPVVWQRASSIVVGLVLAHSAVDYPLRTPAILLVAAFCAAVLGRARAVDGTGDMTPRTGAAF